MLTSQDLSVSGDLSVDSYAFPVQEEGLAMEGSTWREGYRDFPEE